MTSLMAVLMAVALGQSAGSMGALPNGMNPRWQPTYCAGFQAGYTKGWCFDVNAICPVPAAQPCPPPEPGRTDWSDGYVRGFEKGKAAKLALPGYQPRRGIYNPNPPQRPVTSFLN